MNAKLIDSKTITTNTYQVEYDNQKYIMTEYLDHRGKVIDSILRDAQNDSDIDDPEIVEACEMLVDQVATAK